MCGSGPPVDRSVLHGLSTRLSTCCAFCTYVCSITQLAVGAKGRVKAGGQCKRKGKSWRPVQKKGSKLAVSAKQRVRWIFRAGYLESCVLFNLK